ncbi:MAG TPA: RNA-binding protein [Pseudolabrys sp.]|nr:RNA-binding protein [Pseudolabrys sp.]
MLARPHSEDLDGGPKGAASERTCALTRTQKPTGEMVRFVVGPDGKVVPDVRRKLPGRGLWITATQDALREAIKRNLFSRGFKKEVRVGTELVEQTGELLARAALDALAIAGKASLVVTGFSKVEAALGSEKLVGLLHAADGAADGKRKIDAALRRQSPLPEGRVEIVGGFTSAQLDLALGRLNVVHAALLAGSASETFLARALRYERFRT